MLASQHELFEIPQGVTYLDCARSAPLAKPVILAGQEALAQGPWSATRDQAGYEAARARAARIIGAGCESVMLTPCPGPRLGLAVQGLALKREKTVLLLEGWADWPDLAGWSVANLARPRSGDWTEAVIKALGNVSLAVLPHCHPADGSVLDLALIRQACDQAGVVLAVDCGLSLGVMPVDVAKVRPDFLFAAADKWLFCPPGVNIFYQDPALGPCRACPEDQAPTGLWAMAEAGLGLVEGFGIQNIRATLTRISNRLGVAGQAFGLDSPPCPVRAPHILTLLPPRGHAPALARAMASHKTFVGTGGEFLRLSPHLYIGDEDVERFTTTLARCLCT